MSSFNDSLTIFEMYKIKHSPNGYFGFLIDEYETDFKNNNFNIQIWNTAEDGLMIFQIFKTTPGMIIYKPVKVKDYENK